MAIEKLTYSASLITQGKNRFYSLTMPIEALAKTCYVSTREEDIEQGFQRTLDAKKAQDIANYIDNESGIIPNSIVLSAQEDSNFVYSNRNRSVTFDDIPKAFLVLDGQHRIYGFKLAKSDLRVPVVIFEGLSRVQEAKLFIDINTKQKPVSNELLLDIKSLARMESDQEEYIRELFNLFDREADSCLKGLMSPSTKSKGKISRVTFNKAVKPLIGKVMLSHDAAYVYKVLNQYLEASKVNIDRITGQNDTIVSPIIFSAILSLFTKISSKVKDKYSGNYSVDNFVEVMKPIFDKVKPNSLKNPGTSYKKLSEQLEDYLENQPFNL
jgi:DGQHR domain-containing protein